MAGQNATEIVIAKDGAIYVAAVNTAAPASATAALASATWTDLGYATEDGVSWSRERTTTEYNVWQEMEPVRVEETARGMTATFSLVQWNEDTLEFAFGGTYTGGVFTPAAAGTIDTRAFIVDWVDGTKYWRLYLPKVTVTESVESSLTRTDMAAIPVTVRAMAQAGVDLYKLMNI